MTVRSQGSDVVVERNPEDGPMGRGRGLEDTAKETNFIDTETYRSGLGLRVLLEKP